MSDLVINDTYIQVNEIDGDCCITPWSRFLLSKLPICLNGKNVCDFGAGTGVLSIASAIKSSSNIISIEKNVAYRELMIENFKRNNLDDLIQVFTTSYDFMCKEYFDYIFCNPACYPNFVGNCNFYKAGALGLDMINEVITYSSITLNKNGHLYMLIPSVSPSSKIITLINRLCMTQIIGDSIYVPIRENIKNKVIQWVENNMSIYSEMIYYNINGVISERVDFYDITFK